MEIVLHFCFVTLFSTILPLVPFLVYIINVFEVSLTHTPTGGAFVEAVRFYSHSLFYLALDSQRRL